MDSKTKLSERELEIALHAAQTLLKVRVLNKDAIAALKRANGHWNSQDAMDSGIIMNGVRAALHALKLIGAMQYARNDEMIVAIAAAVVWFDGE